LTRFRVLVATAAAVMFAAALGIALGAGSLQDDMNDVFVSETAADGPDPQLARRQAELELTVRFDNDAIGALAPSLLSTRLQGRPVVVLALPTAVPRHVHAVEADVEAAGGSITGVLDVGADLVDPAARTLVDTLSAGQLEEYDDVEVPPGAGVYDRVGLVMARALLTPKDGGEPLDDGARSVVNGFTTAELLWGEPPEQRASLAVVVAGPLGGEGEDATARGSIVADLVGQLRAGSDGVVVAGPPGAAAEGGAVDAVRNDTDAAPEVSTVDALNSRLGQVGAVLALAEQASGGVGHYGQVDAPDGAMPR
jgi:Copper transport outer membrane protein, MctB